jgi:DNA polymerase-1
MSTAPGGPAETLVLIDAHALIFQSFHAIPAMMGPDGQPTNALFGFSRDLLYVRDEMKPTYLVCAFDTPDPTFRSGLYPEYKAHRPPPPDDLISQLPRIQSMIGAFNLPVLATPGFEADDLIATVAAAGHDRGLEVLICTSDKDCRQLITDRVRMFNLRKREPYDAASLLRDWGVTPEQVVDFQALVGDSVDNVPGVPGIGPKTACKFLGEYKTLDNLLAHVEDLPKSKLKDNLKANVELARLSRELVRLKADVPVPLAWDDWRVRDWDGPRLLKIFEGAGFRSLSAKVRSSRSTLPGSSVECPSPGSPSATTGDLFGEMGAPLPDKQLPVEKAPARDWSGDYRLIDTQELFDDFLRQLRKQSRFAFDLETTSLESLQAEIVGWAISWKAGEAYYLPVRGPDGSKLLDAAGTLIALKPILEDAAIAKVNQNIKYDALVLRAAGVHVAGIAGDPMVADYLLRAGERSHNLDEMARHYLGHENISITELIGKKGKAQLSMDQVPPDKVCAYAGEDADVAWRLTELLEAKLPAEGVAKLYSEVEIPLIGVLLDMEAEGIRIDVPYLTNLSAKMATELERLEGEIHAAAGREFNIASLKQLRVVLFDELKLPVQKRTGLTNEASTDQETLEKLAALGYELPRKIIEHRQICKLQGTYVDALPALVNPDTGRLHTSFNQAVATTGRLSSSDPNLQNIPARTDLGREIRQAFIPRDGWTLVTADYSQVELRLLAHFSGDAALKTAFAQNKDIHSSVAARIFGVPEDKVLPDQRRVAKTVNFGVIYGMSAFGLAQRLGIMQGDAARFIDDYFAGFPAVQAYQEKLLRRCAERKFVSTILGRRRKIEGVRPTATVRSLNQPEREAVNMEIQGSAADLMKLAMLAVQRRLKSERLRAKMLLTVHDELVFESPPDEVTALAALARREMTQALPLDVPLTVDIAAGPNWLEGEELP